ncbi:MAG: hypothetical protein R3C56_23075 [Pirellulaceae bacterium]
MSRTIALCLAGFLLLSPAHQRRKRPRASPVPELTSSVNPASPEPAEVVSVGTPTVEKAPSPAAAVETAVVEVAVDVTGESVAEEPDPTHDPATHEPVDDKNYQLLGEYAGTIETPGNPPQPFGLQVRPLGGDRFEARQYTGGLPGQEGFSGQSQSLIGFRAGDALILSGATWAVFVDRDQCRVIDREGNRLGELGASCVPVRPSVPSHLPVPRCSSTGPIPSSSLQVK